MEIGMEWAVSFIFITICTIADIRKKEIPVAVIAVFCCISLFCMKIWGKREWMDLIYSIIPGMLLLLLGFCTRQSIGYGDGLVISVLGLCIGYRGCIAVIMIGLLVSSVCALVLLVGRKVEGKSRIPFVPFLAIGWGVFYIVQKGL